MNEDVPSDVQNGGVFGDLLNRIFSCLKRRNVISGDGISLVQTKDGVKVSADVSDGQIIWIKACLEDATECYVPVRVAGNPRRSIGDDTDYDPATIEEEDIPDGSIVLDPP